MLRRHWARARYRILRKAPSPGQTPLIKSTEPIATRNDDTLVLGACSWLVGNPEQTSACLTASQMPADLPLRVGYTASVAINPSRTDERR
ncbi:hypothetical protein U5801_07880 [Lamprobacter modestohalophilus]|uniref:hypothetical protein n=1 Tax=Lamprobacter modestohalophilus TaxID=1064514 RepID=UPI002ADECFD7|nr:hypothetical protein [Lamprobacter modestohalophilus]MEA1049725.1 hypothetical protein [Lamprobacter modestohalophilus]